MKHETIIRWFATELTPRAKLYSLAFAVTLLYLFVGRVSNDSQGWVQVDLPISSASVLVMGIAAAETFLALQRARRQQEELRAARAREIESAERCAQQRRALLNEITRTLIDRLDYNQMPAEVPEKIRKLFEADIVGVWVADKIAGPGLRLISQHGLDAAAVTQFQSLPWSFAGHADAAGRARQILVREVGDDPADMLAGLCAAQQLRVAALSPILRRDELVGLVGVFYRQPVSLSPTLTAEMQTVANIIAGAMQAEALYRDLVQAQKVETIGTLTSGIAHDFNNVLAAILACATYVKQRTDPRTESYRYLEATEASAHRGAALTKQLLSFARREAPRKVVLDLNTLIEQTLKMLERSFDKSILFHKQLARDLRPVEADPSQLEQVILNIAVNARDAMPDGGIFTISTRNARLAPDMPPRPPLELPAGDYVVLAFRDTGHGMDAKTLKRIFEPFFTTKRPGKGTGLGLSVVVGIIRSFGGEVRVESQPGKGTLFEFYLPATNKPLPVAETVPATGPRGGNESILLAEDEEVIREMAKLALEARGYRVIAAPDGAAAMALYREHARHISLVIADMAMPRMSGPELFAALKELDPAVRVVVSSGYSHDQEGQRMLQHGCLGYLQKPYNPDALCQLVRSVLDSGL
jgi:signal transduction histidine kinase